MSGYLPRQLRFFGIGTAHGLLQRMHPAVKELLELAAIVEGALGALLHSRFAMETLTRALQPGVERIRMRFEF